MHRFIATAFSRALSLIHLLVVVFLTGWVLTAPSQLLFVFGAFVGYVLFAGFLSTLLVMAQNLERIASAVEKSGGNVVAGNNLGSTFRAGVKERREPPLSSDGR